MLGVLHSVSALAFKREQQSRYEDARAHEESRMQKFLGPHRNPILGG